MTEEERIRIFENFLKNGMNISPFGFRSDYDKENFFTMVEEYLTAMSDKAVNVSYDYNNDMTIHIDDRFICSYMINSSYTTLTATTGLDITDEDLTLCFTMLFLTVKELTSMIKSLTEMFSKLQGDEKDDEDKYYKSNSNRKFVPTSNLPKNIQNNINKIRELQKSILSENQKYKISKTKKDKED